MSRFVSTQPGITSWHSFSAGAYYDPDNVSFGPVIGLDEHSVEPGAGFGWHGHRDVAIVSRVLEGMLRHEDSSGEVHVVGPGEFLVQSTGDGVRHTETNASDTLPLRFLQLTLLGSTGAAEVRRTSGPVEVAAGLVDVRVTMPEHVPAFVFAIGSGADLRLTEPATGPGPAGERLVVLLSDV